MLCMHMLFNLTATLWQPVGHENNAGCRVGHLVKCTVWCLLSVSRVIYVPVFVCVGLLLPGTVMLCAACMHLRCLSRHIVGSAEVDQQDPCSSCCVMWWWCCGRGDELSC